MKYQVITTMEKCNKELSYAEKNSLCKLAFFGIDLKESNTNRFAIDNGWKVADETCMFGASYTSFDVVYGFDYNKIDCKSCAAIFNSPMEIKKCIVCDSVELETEKKHIRKPVIQESIGFNQELFKQAVQDIKEHPVKQESSVDWQHLADTIGD